MSTQAKPGKIFYESGKTLTAAASSGEQAWFVDLWQRNNRAILSAGILAGLEVQIHKQETLEIQPGSAVDKLGHLIVLAKKQSLSPSLGPGDYLLWVTYGSYPADYYQQSSTVKGFRLLVEEPNFGLSRQVPENALTLGSVRIDRRGKLVDIGTGLGEMQRHQIGLNVGKLNLYNRAFETSSKIEGKKGGLSFDADLLHVFGGLEVGAQLGVGMERPYAGLTVSAETNVDLLLLNSHKGTVTQHRLDENQVIGEQENLHVEMRGFGRQMRKITRRVGPDKVQVHKPFTLPLNNAKQVNEPNVLGEFGNYSRDVLLRLGLDGSVGIGARKAHGDRFSINVTTQGMVGIGVTPTKARLEVAGGVVADYLVGNGARLHGLPSLWTRGPDDAEFIYHEAGSVGIGTDNPLASLQVRETFSEPYINNMQLNPGDCLDPGNGATMLICTKGGRGDRVVFSAIDESGNLTHSKPDPRKTYRVRKPIVRFSSIAGVPGLGKGTVSIEAGSTLIQLSTARDKNLQPGSALTIFSPKPEDTVECLIERILSPTLLQAAVPMTYDTSGAPYAFTPPPIAQDVPAMVILGNGNVGINVVAPLDAMDVGGGMIAKDIQIGPQGQRVSMTQDGTAHDSSSGPNKMEQGEVRTATLTVDGTLLVGSDIKAVASDGSLTCDTLDTVNSLSVGQDTEITSAGLSTGSVHVVQSLSVVQSLPDQGSNTQANPNDDQQTSSAPVIEAGSESGTFGDNQATILAASLLLGGGGTLYGAASGSTNLPTITANGEISIAGLPSQAEQLNLYKQSQDISTFSDPLLTVAKGTVSGTNLEIKGNLDAVDFAPQRALMMGDMSQVTFPFIAATDGLLQGTAAGTMTLDFPAAVAGKKSLTFEVIDEAHGTNSSGWAIFSWHSGSVEKAYPSYIFVPVPKGTTVSVASGFSGQIWWVPQGVSRLFQG